MKARILIVGLIFFTEMANAVWPPPYHDPLPNAGEGYREQVALYAQQDAQRQRQAEISAVQIAELNFIHSKDPWRNINGSTNYIGAEGWSEFQGRALKIMPDGVLFQGSFGQILSIYPTSNGTRLVTRLNENNEYKQEKNGVSASNRGTVSSGYEANIFYGDDFFFVENFPYPADSKQGYYQMLAMPVGYFNYTNTSGQALTVPKFNYGTPCLKIWSPAEIAEMKKRVDNEKQKSAAKILKYNEDAAAKNDPYGLMRMGERYRDGEGVVKDLAQARIYLQKAADAGSDTAKTELDKLPLP